MARTCSGSLVAACALALAGCNLYFGGSGGGGPGSGPGGELDAPWGWGSGVVDAGAPDATTGPPPYDAPQPTSYTFATCSGGQLYKSAPQQTDIAPPDIAKSGASFAACASRCREPAGVYDCGGDPSCAAAQAWLCEPDADCPADGASCTAGASHTCSTSADCILEVATETCGCTGGKESCTSPCADGLCSPVDVLHAIAGHWQGAVSPPAFSPPYLVDLTIAPDGHLTPYALNSQTPAFYYGLDGPDAGRYFNILAESDTGAIGTVGVDFGYGEIIPGLITGLHVSANKLEFTFWASWLGDCGSDHFDFQLTRVP